MIYTKQQIRQYRERRAAAEEIGRWAAVVGTKKSYEPRACTDIYSSFSELVATVQMYCSTV
jgi:hypothetical protein